MNSTLLYPQSADRASALLPHDFYYEIGAYIFPVNMQTKLPFKGFSWKHLASNDREQHRRWAAEYPGCGWAMYAAKSRILVADKDVKNVGEAAAQATWKAECAAAHLSDAVPPNVTTPSGGAHMYFRLPDGFDETTLTQPDWVKGIIDVRTVGYVLIPPSMRDGKAYSLVRREIEPCPEVFLERFTQKIATDAEEREARGDFDFGLVSSVVRWILNNTDRFDSEFDWVFDTLAVRDAFPDDRGYSLACEMAYCDQQNRLGGIWNRKNDYRGKPRTCATLIKYARDNGYTGRTASEMFGGVTVAAPTASGAIPLMSGMKAACDLGLPIVDTFNQAHLSVPHATDALSLPIEMNAPDLRGPLNDAIGKILTIARVKQRAFKFTEIAEVVGVLSAVHQPTVAPLIELVRATGARVPDGALRSAEQRFESAIMAEGNAQSGFITNAKGLPDPDVSENVDFLLRQMGVDLRFDEFRRQFEYRVNAVWRPFDDAESDKIKRTANSKVYNFRTSKDFLETNIRVLARENSFDSLTDLVDCLDAEWDGVNRLDTWLPRACGLIDDEYHRMVGRSIVGGMVSRARDPGCRHDETALIIGPTQGAGKSEITKILALDDPNLILERYGFNESDQNALPKLAGKWVVELSELANMAKADVEDVKAFLTTRTDRYTAKYDKYARDHPRRFIFIATTNDDKPLKDETGNRRFLPVRVPGEVDTSWLRSNVRQIIGEGARRHGAGETFSVPRELWAVAATHQEAARQEKSAEIHLREIFAPFDGVPIVVKSADVLRALQLRGVRDNKIGGIMQKLNFRDDRNRASRFYISTGRHPAMVPQHLQFIETNGVGRFSYLPSVQLSLPAPPY